MGLVYGVRRFLVGMVLVALGAVGCTVSDVKAPELQGPSELALSLAMTAVPDVLPLDGASQAQIAVSARDANADPLPNVTFRAEIVAGGEIVDCGSLSARTLITGGDGRAILVYTAPTVQCDSSGHVAVSIIPFGTDAANRCEWPSWCWSPSPFRVVRPAVAPRRKPRARMSPAAQAKSPTRWNPNIE